MVPRRIWFACLSAAVCSALITGCSTQGANSSPTPTSFALPTVDIEAASYFDPQDLGVWRSWGSHVAVVTVLGEDYATQTITPAQGGQERPIEDRSLRQVTLEVSDVLWSRENAVSPVAESAILKVHSLGYSEDGNSAVVVDGWTRMDVGGTYVVALIDDLVDGEPVLDYLDGSAIEVTSSGALNLVTPQQKAMGATEVADIAGKVRRASVDPAVPEPGELRSWDERISEFLMSQ